MPEDPDVAIGGKRMMRDRRVVLLGLAALVVAMVLIFVSMRSPIEPAAEGESLILVVDFTNQADVADRSEARGIDPAQVIYEALLTQTQEDGLTLRIERLREVADAQSVAEVREYYHATLIVWGRRDALTVTPRVDPVPFAFGAFTDISAQVRPLALSVLGAYHFALEDYPRAIGAMDRALLTIASDIQTVFANEDAFAQGTSMRYMSDSDRTVADLYQSATRYHNAFAFFNRGLAYRALGDVGKAIADFEQARALSNESDLQSRAGEQIAQLDALK